MGQRSYQRYTPEFKEQALGQTLAEIKRVGADAKHVRNNLKEEKFYKDVK